MVVDDTRAIHDDFRGILCPEKNDHALDTLAAGLFSDHARADEYTSQKVFQLSSAYQGREALELVEESLVEGPPFAMAFVDMRMPPGWDGLETIQALWAVAPALHVVICTAHSDHSWADIVRRLGENDRLLVIKKPFEAVEVIQCAHALCEKWRLQQLDRQRLAELESRVEERTRHLELAKQRLEREMVERERVEVQLRHAQKMEAVGQLAAGIAHEINTPIQYIGNSVEFLREGFSTVSEMVTYYRRLLELWRGGAAYDTFSAEVVGREEAADIDYVLSRAPGAFERSNDGIARVTKIVRAMKEFAYPSANEQQPADLNHSIETTLEVARSEYKLVADVETAFAEIPEVTCSVGDLNQVFLNLVVNAAHAIAAVSEQKGRGKIRVATEARGEHVVIRVSDTGAGIQPDILHKIFDPFFTTKPVGKGTGQGLAIAHAVVVDKHAGTIDVESTPGEGTTFVVSLPVAGNQNGAPQVA